MAGVAGAMRRAYLKCTRNKRFKALSGMLQEYGNILHQPG